MNVNGCNIFPHEGIQWHTFVSYILPCQILLCQPAPLPPSVTQQHNVMEYWWEGSASAAIPPASACTVVGQQDKIGGVTLEQPSYTVN